MRRLLGSTRRALMAALVHWVFLAAVALAVVLLAAFVELSEALIHARSAPEDSLDILVLRFLAGLRRPWLNAIAVELTALGSPLVVALFTIVAPGLLRAFGDRRGAGLLVVASLASALLTNTLKGLLERPRPDVVSKLVHVASLSYPSGHSLASSAVYLTAALVVARHLPSTAHRIVALLSAAVLVLFIGASRVYLGVHYPSDVVAGIMVGTAWASLMAAALRMLDRRHAPKRAREETADPARCRCGRARARMLPR